MQKVEFVQHYLEEASEEVRPFVDGENGDKFIFTVSLFRAVELCLYALAYSQDCRVDDIQGLPKSYRNLYHFLSVTEKEVFDYADLKDSLVCNKVDDLLAFTIKETEKWLLINPTLKPYNEDFKRLNSPVNFQVIGVLEVLKNDLKKKCPLHMLIVTVDPTTRKVTDSADLEVMAVIDDNIGYYLDVDELTSRASYLAEQRGISLLVNFAERASWESGHLSVSPLKKDIIHRGWVYWRAPEVKEKLSS